MSKNKTALVLGGGGCAISYSTGVLFKLIEYYGMEKPNMLFSGSAGSSLAAFYISDKINERKKDGTKLFSSKKLVNPIRFRKIMDLDHLIYKIYPEKYGITTELLQKKTENTERHIAMTNVQTGKATTFNANERKTSELIRASMAIGIAYGRKVSIQGKKYIDGPFSASTEFLIDQAIKKGANKIIAISPRSFKSPHRKSNDRLTKLWLISKPKLFRKQVKSDNINKLKMYKKYELPSEGVSTCCNNKLLYISPIVKEFKHELAENDIITLKTSILQGKVDTITNPIIKEFVENRHQ